VSGVTTNSPVAIPNKELSNRAAIEECGDPLLSKRKPDWGDLRKQTGMLLGPPDLEEGLTKRIVERVRSCGYQETHQRSEGKSSNSASRPSGGYKMGDVEKLRGEHKSDERRRSLFPFLERGLFAKGKMHVREHFVLSP